MSIASRARRGWMDLYPGNEATLNFYLNNFTDVSSLVNAVRTIENLGGNTNTTGGLRLMRTEIFNPANGDRPYIENVAVLITDGVPTREVDKLDGELRDIRSRGIDIVGVGVTERVLYTEIYITMYITLSNSLQRS